MADEPDDPDEAADRLEAALERIARLAAVPASPVDHAPVNAGDEEMSVAEIAERLDGLISRLRAALGDAAKPE